MVIFSAERLKLGDRPGCAGGAHGALENSRDARTDSGEAVRRAQG